MTLLRLGETVLLTATVHEPDGRIISGITVNWKSEDGSVVTVDAAGLVTAVGTGVATVRAGAEGLETSSTPRVDLHRGVLVAMHETLGGPEWVHNRHWGTDEPIGSRWGVSGAAPPLPPLAVDPTGDIVLPCLQALPPRVGAAATIQRFGKPERMPNIKSARKRMQLSRAARSRNRVTRSRIRTAIRRVREAGSWELADEHRRAAVALIDRAATRRVLHPNKAGRIKSQLDRLVRELA